MIGNLTLNKEKLIMFARRGYRKINPLKTVQPDWRQILGDDFKEWERLLKRVPLRGKILLPTSLGIHVGVTTIESLLALALTLRGAEAHMLLCDKVLPACQDCIINYFLDDKELVIRGPRPVRCNSCFDEAYKMYSSLGVKVHLYSEFLGEEELSRAEKISREIPVDEINSFRLDGVALGEHAMAGAIRFYACADLKRHKHWQDVLRKYFKAALLTMYVMDNIYKKIRFDCAAFHHGIYIPQGVIGEVTRKRSVRVVNWTIAYRKNCFIFCHNDTYHHALLSEPVSEWGNLKWPPARDKKLNDYLKSRRDGTHDWISFHRRPKKALSDIKKELNIDFSKPSIGLLTNVVWDAQLHYPVNAFKNMMEWVLYSIDYFIKRKDLQLIIRVHPAEITGFVPSRQPVVREIARVYPELPSNIIIVPPENRLSTYVLMELCDSAIIYGTKTGVELTGMGIPVIVAGEAWIRNKGITFDASSVDGYKNLLDGLPFGKRLDEKTWLKARKYAYHFFFRKMIPLECLLPLSGWPPYHVKQSRLSDFMTGQDKGLDVICDGILENKPFVYMAETQEDRNNKEKESVCR